MADAKTARRRKDKGARSKRRRESYTSRLWKPITTAFSRQYGLWFYVGHFCQAIMTLPILLLTALFMSMHSNYTVGIGKTFSRLYVDTARLWSFIPSVFQYYYEAANEREDAPVPNRYIEVAAEWRFTDYLLCIPCYALRAAGCVLALPPIALYMTVGIVTCLALTPLSFIADMTWMCIQNIKACYQGNQAKQVVKKQQERKSRKVGHNNVPCTRAADPDSRRDSEAHQQDTDNRKRKRGEDRVKAGKERRKPPQTDLFARTRNPPRRDGRQRVTRGRRSTEAARSEHMSYPKL